MSSSSSSRLEEEVGCRRSTGSDRPANLGQSWRHLELELQVETTEHRSQLFNLLTSIFRALQPKLRLKPRLKLKLKSKS